MNVEIGEERRRKLEVSSVNLVRRDQCGKPVKGGTGCLITYKGSRYLLTVTHNIGGQAFDEDLEVITSNVPYSELLLPMCYDPTSKGTLSRAVGRLLRPLRAGEAFEGMTDPLEILEDIDLSFCRLPFDELPLFQNRNATTGELEKRECTVFASSFKEPEIGANYAFAGHTNAKMSHDAEQGLWFRHTEFKIAYGITYVGETANDFGVQYAFKLPEGHPVDNDYYKGCSGAPIVDEQNRVVALVSRGNVSKSLVFGVPLKKYQAAWMYMPENL